MTHQPSGSLLVGSIPLSDAEDVFRTAADRLGSHLKRMPDGETGDRAGWVAWQGPNFKLPQLELVKPMPGQYPPTLPRCLAYREFRGAHSYPSSSSTGG
jgi:hypothetical protein